MLWSRHSVRHEQLYCERLRYTEAQMSHAERREHAGLPWMADHPHAVCLSAVRQHPSAQPPHRHLQVSKPTETGDHEHWPALSGCLLSLLSVCASHNSALNEGHLISVEFDIYMV